MVRVGTFWGGEVWSLFSGNRKKVLGSFGAKEGRHGRFPTKGLKLGITGRDKKGHIIGEVVRVSNGLLWEMCNIWLTAPLVSKGKGRQILDIVTTSPHGTAYAQRGFKSRRAEKVFRFYISYLGGWGIYDPSRGVYPPRPWGGRVLGGGRTPLWAGTPGL